VFAGKYMIEAFEPDVKLKPPYDPTKDKLAALGLRRFPTTLARLRSR